MKLVLLKIWRVLRNKYILATLCFIVFFIFIDENNLIVSMRLQRRVERLRAEERTLVQSYKEDSIKACSLKDDLRAIEKYGRETYYMKRPDEDIFIINTSK
ncbi:MAG: septum formation initiator family protein [Bacteroidales bacterium]|nr:septum formation initiator family protein [Bacteroidales bacterium]